VRRRFAAIVVGLACVLAAGCAGGDDAGDVATERHDAEAPPSSAAGAGTAQGYTPVSAVDAHAAIGDDAARIREALGAAKSGPVDWTAVRRHWQDGGASKKGDGTNRTLAALVPAPDVVRAVEDAIAGTGPSAGASDAVRAQRVDKGITVILARKVVDELVAADRKVGDGNLDRQSGAAHNVDEAWAFLMAKGQGPASTAEKRAADFNRQGKVLEPVLAGLASAQHAALAGDRAGLARSAQSVREGLDYVFYLATHKYLGSDNETGRAEGAAFYLGIAPRVREVSPSVDETIVESFATGDVAAGRGALHESGVLVALGVDDQERVDRG
jgi:hypothetical protein